MAIENNSNVSPNERQQKCLAKAVLLMGKKRFALQDNIRALIETFEILPFKESRLRRKLDEEHKEQMAVATPEDRVRLEDLRSLLVYDNFFWRSNMIEGLVIRELKNQREGFGSEPYEQYEPSPYDIQTRQEEYKRENDPFFEEMPAFIAQVEKLRDDFSELSPGDLSGADFIQKSIVNVLKLALRKLTMKVAKPAVLNCLASLETIANADQGQLERWSAGESMEVVVRAVKGGRPAKSKRAVDDFLASHAELLFPESQKKKPTVVQVAELVAQQMGSKLTARAVQEKMKGRWELNLVMIKSKWAAKPQRLET